jgi:hypothetical protein
MPGTQFGLQPPKLRCGIVSQNSRERRIRCLERRKARQAAHTHPDPRRFDSHTTEKSIDTSLTTIMHRQIRMAMTAYPRDFADFFHLILENSTLDFFQDQLPSARLIPRLSSDGSIEHRSMTPISWDRHSPHPNSVSILIRTFTSNPPASKLSG